MEETKKRNERKGTDTMKKTRRIIAVLFSLAMLLTTNSTVFAATISGPDSDSYSGHSYEIYQLFTGDYGNGALTNLKWGQNNTEYQTEQVTKQVCNQCGAQFDTADDALHHIMSSEGCENYSSRVIEEPAAVPSTVTDALSAVISSSEKEKLEMIRPYADLDSEPYGTVRAGEQLKDVPSGYYLIKDTDNNYDNENDSYTQYIVAVVGEDLTITPKADVPTFEKKLKDMDDTANAATDWQDSADSDKGDTISFQLKGTVADNYDDYDTYKFIIHDQESTGLTLDPESIVVKIDGNMINPGEKAHTYDYICSNCGAEFYTVNDITAHLKENVKEGCYGYSNSPCKHTSYELVTEDLTDDCTFEVRFSDLKSVGSAHAGSEITVEYNATLNEQAVIGKEGNVSRAKLEFSNNPNEGQDNTGETPWDTVKVFTYKTVVNTVDSEGKALAGAAFKVEKNVNGTWTKIKEFAADTSTTSFSFDGLDDGTYRLTETKVPDGCDPIDPIEFTITAEHSVIADDPVLTALNGNVTGDAVVFAANLDTGSLTTNIINRTEADLPEIELPETGGIGTYIFYAVGAITMAGAVVIFIVRKRAGK